MSLDETLVSKLYKAAESGNKHITFIKSKSEENMVSYEDLFKKAQMILKHLQSSGLKKGDQVIIQLGDNESFLYTYWACILGGIVPIPLDYINNKEQINKLISICDQLNDFRIVIEERNFFSLQDSLLQNSRLSDLSKIEGRILFFNSFNEDIGFGDISEVNKDDIAFIQYSSGSTGKPKGVVLTHENLITNILGMIETAEITDEDTFLSWMPLYHDMGLIGLHLMPLVKNINQYNMPTQTFVRRPLLWLDKVTEKKATILASPNFGYKYLLSKYKNELDYGWDLRNVKTIFNGAEPISVSLCKKFAESLKKYGLREESMYTVYGLAEASLAVAFPKAGERIKSVQVSRKSVGFEEEIIEVFDGEDVVEFAVEGQPVKGCEFRIVNSKDEILPEKYIGNIQIKGNNVTKGYYKNLNNKDCFSKDGWLNTGDLGFIKDNDLVVTGREKDIIIVQGQNYYLHDIERVVEELDGVSIDGVVACSVQSHENEDVLVIFVKNRNMNDDFIELCRDIKRIVNREFGIVVHSIIPVKVIPRTTSGKIQRYRLVESYYIDEVRDLEVKIKELLKEKELTAKDDDYNYDYIEECLIKIWRNVLRNDNISIDDNFFEIGGNSTLLVELIANIDKEFPNRILITDMFNRTTIRQIADFIREKSREVSNIRKQIVFKPEVTKKFINMIKAQSLDIYDFLCGVFILTLTKNHNDVEVDVYALDNGKEKSIKLDMYKQDIFELIRDITKQKKLNPDLLCDCSKDNENKILALITNEDVTNEDAIINRYDNIMFFEIENDELQCVFTANRNVSKEKNEEISNSFDQMLNIILENQ
ncbi:mutanobactin A non-ribosomal peptide synthetase MubE [Paraclostridium ghonii]|uniref:Acyl-CoA synthetase (AMP-forming)/AMP-acid ligase II/acyl carrier protein n=1 Tax=Paraclostridium ghonii TaxID=29358 RepID=A0ABU0N023_9FIRM|nr:non-ribosomal peptide synthetase [Paeniclostridium ghonii]MDQ0556516.1 acyl-CoA synthetase (AMP-forming)/AMP-acid ligase II/acyl carrier protein [Paeniclostridium ghonii]